MLALIGLDALCQTRRCDRNSRIALLLNFASNGAVVDHKSNFELQPLEFLSFEQF